MKPRNASACSAISVYSFTNTATGTAPPIIVLLEILFVREVFQISLMFGIGIIRIMPL